MPSGTFFLCLWKGVDSEICINELGLVFYDPFFRRKGGNCTVGNGSNYLTQYLVDNVTSCINSRDIGVAGFIGEDKSLIIAGYAGFEQSVVWDDAYIDKNTIDIQLRDSLGGTIKESNRLHRICARYILNYRIPDNLNLVIGKGPLLGNLNST